MRRGAEPQFNIDCYTVFKQKNQSYGTFLRALIKEQYDMTYRTRDVLHSLHGRRGIRILTKEKR